MIFQYSLIISGSKRLIEHFYQTKVPIALATSSGKESVVAKTANYLQLFDCFNHKVMGSSDAEVKFGKPHPDIFLICASRFSNPPKPENVSHFIQFNSKCVYITSNNVYTIKCFSVWFSKTHPTA